jgi:hypothetical protein
MLWIALTITTAAALGAKASPTSAEPRDGLEPAAGEPPREPGSVTATTAAGAE